MNEPISVAYQVISSDYTRWDKAKRFGRSLLPKAQKIFSGIRDKLATVKDAIARFFSQLRKASNHYYSEVTSILNEIKNDLSGGEDMGLMTFLFGPPVQPQEQTGNYTDFTTGNVAGSMMSAVVSQQGFVSDEQVEQFGEIAKNSEANLKRLKVALDAIKRVSGNETEATKEVFAVMKQLERDSFKRSEYQAQRRKESQILQEKFSNLRKGL